MVLSVWNEPVGCLLRLSSHFDFVVLLIILVHTLELALLLLQFHQVLVWSAPVQLALINEVRSDVCHLEQRECEYGLILAPELEVELMLLFATLRHRLVGDPQLALEIALELVNQQLACLLEEFLSREGQLLLYFHQHQTLPRRIDVLDHFPHLLVVLAMGHVKHSAVVRFVEVLVDLRYDDVFLPHCTDGLLELLEVVLSLCVHHQDGVMLVQFGRHSAIFGRIHHCLLLLLDCLADDALHLGVLLALDALMRQLFLHFVAISVYFVHSRIDAFVFEVA